MAPEATADLAFVSGAVHTVDRSRPRAEAVAIAGGRILAVGADAEIREHVGPATEVHDLAGRTMLPGFQDAHVHPPSAGVGMNQCDLTGAHSIEEYSGIISAYAAAHPELPWILGDGWSMDVFPGGTPTAQELDDGTSLPFEDLDDRGGYLQGVWGFRRRWAAGLRFDWADGDDPADPLRDARRRYSTNVTFYPSEFSKLRLQYSLDDAEHLAHDVSTVALQFEVLYGAHGGHKF